MENRKWYIYSLSNISCRDLRNDNFIDEFNLDAIKGWMNNKWIRFAVWWENGYHSKFKNIIQSPYIVYYKWNINLLDSKILGIVWTRKISWYWRSILDKLFSLLDKYDGVVTISWLANWVDKYSHDLSMKFNIPTIAVLWWWFANYLRWRDGWFIEKIVNSWWLILSDFRLKETSNSWTFPFRNRIIAWLSDRVFIPEAWPNSWSLITARYAYNMGIPVHGVMNSIHVDGGKWVNEAISRNQIIPVYDIEKFVVDVFWDKIKEHIDLDLDDRELIVLDVIKNYKTITIEEIANISKFKVSDILEIITMLEINWLISEIKPWIYNIL